ncbi:hypothetical protein LTR95_001523 [Oleoguttula sp. CCFEE 5521]
MAALYELPAELLVNILGRLPKTDQKALRCTSRESAKLATPLVFSEVVFDLEPGGCDGLASIAESTRLQHHVHTVRLCRRRGLRLFRSFDDWHDSNIYEHIPDIMLFGEPRPLRTDSRLLSRDQWAALGDDARRIMYEEYQLDVDRLDRYFSRLAFAMCEWIARRYGTTIEATTQASDAWHLLHRYDIASRAFRHVHTFIHIPTYRFDENNWGSTWRNVGFHEFALVECCWGKDPLYDTVELFAALAIRTTATVALRSLTLGTQGHAFWSTQQLCQLLHWMRNLPEDRGLDHGNDDGLELWLADIGGPLPVLRHVEYLTRALVAVGREFTGLAHLECRIDTLQADRQDELEPIAAGVSSSLAEATMLERLNLAFRNEALTDDEGDRAFFGCDYEPGRGRIVWDLDLTAASERLMRTVSTLQHLRHLQLSLATTAPTLVRAFSPLKGLRFLRLSYMPLFVGQWDAVLTWVAGNLSLHRVELLVLEDVFCGRPRLILDSEAPVWKSSSVPDGWYDEYEDSITQYALGKSYVLPMLSQEEYVERRLLVALDTETSKGGNSN